MQINNAQHVRASWSSLFLLFICSSPCSYLDFILKRMSLLLQPGWWFQWMNGRLPLEDNRIFHWDRSTSPLNARLTFSRSRSRSPHSHISRQTFEFLRWISVLLCPPFLSFFMGLKKSDIDMKKHGIKHPKWLQDWTGWVSVPSRSCAAWYLNPMLWWFVWRSSGKISLLSACFHSFAHKYSPN